MPEAFVKAPPRTLEGWRALWRFTASPYVRQRRATREVRVGDVGIGAANPIRVQSMTIADTMHTAAVVDEIETLANAGSEIVRVTTPNRSAAQNLAAIRAALGQRGVRVPLVADVHFTPQAALIAAEHADKVRINPGNYADRKHFKKWEYSDAEYGEELERLDAAFKPLVLRCKELGVAMRIGTNHGSLSDRILNRFGDTPAGMVESALEFVHICERHGYGDIVLSMKASDVKVMIEAYRLLVHRLDELDMDYPLHLGVTEAGSGLAARVKSSVGIATLLHDGLGDTIRVSLTEDSIHELPVARALVAQVESQVVPGDFTASTRNAPTDGTAATSNASAADTRRDVPRWDPCYFERRRVEPLGGGRARLAVEQPPRIERVVRARPDTLQACIRDVESHPDAGREVDLILVGVQERSTLLELARHARQRAAGTQAAVGVELDLERLVDSETRTLLRGVPWARVSLTADLETWSHGSDDDDVVSALRELTSPLQYTVSVRALPQPSHVQRLAQTMTRGHVPFGAIALEARAPLHAMHAWRAFLAAWPDSAPAVPVVLRDAPPANDGAPVDAFCSVEVLHVAAALGALLADGIGEAVQLHTSERQDAALLAREILQATRMRLSQADFIACPSCGRTQFDLQTTTARIQERLQHLKGLKIAVMGCIVNGPGEMADADFGYVGSGPGRIDLYVGHERVERNVPQDDAVARLIDLIRRHGRWRDPET